MNRGREKEEKEGGKEEESTLLTEPQANEAKNSKTKTKKRKQKKNDYSKRKTGLKEVNMHRAMHSRWPLCNAMSTPRTKLFIEVMN